MTDTITTHTARAKSTSARDTFQPACSCGWHIVSNGSYSQSLRRADKHVLEVELRMQIVHSSVGIVIADQRGMFPAEDDRELIENARNCLSLPGQAVIGGPEIEGTPGDPVFDAYIVVLSAATEEIAAYFETRAVGAMTTIEIDPLGSMTDGSGTYTYSRVGDVLVTESEDGWTLKHRIGERTPQFDGEGVDGSFEIDRGDGVLENARRLDWQLTERFASTPDIGDGNGTIWIDRLAYALGESL